MRVLPSSVTAPKLSIQATSVATTGVGSALGAKPDSPAASDLRIHTGDAVALSARVSPPPGQSAAPPGSFFWRQADGPATLFSQSIGEVSTAISPRVDFTPSVPGIYTFGCTAQASDSQGNATGVLTQRVIRVIADGAARTIPSAAISQSGAATS